MPKLRDIIGYLCRHYPHQNELSKARLTKLVYLADWKAAIDRGSQMTAINWKFNHFGPYVDDVMRVAAEDAAFNVDRDLTVYGNRKDRISLKHPFHEASLSSSDRAVLDHVIAQTRHLSFDSFIQLVYSTYPVLTGQRGSTLDLRRAAAKYREIEAS